MLVLITDAFLRKTFDIINILQKKYPAVQLILTNDVVGGKEKTSAKVLYGQGLELLSKNDIATFEQGLKNIQEKYTGQPIIYLPVEEDTTLLFYQFLERNPQHNFLYRLPTFENFSLARNKEMLWAFCNEHQIPVPKRYTKVDIPALKAAFRKLIVKPKHGSGSKNIQFIDTPEQLDLLNNVDEEAFLVQELINHSSAVHGGFFLFDKGEPVGYYGHERLRTYPVRGGVTVFSKSANNPAVRASGEALLKQLNWSGLAMIEYLYDDVTDTYKVIEINPRLWGSVMLSEFASAGFLINYINLCAGQPLVAAQFEQGRYIRWLFPFDVLGYVRSGLRMKGFWNFNKQTCLINFSYTSFPKAIYFNAFSMLDLKKVKKIFRR